MGFQTNDILFFGAIFVIMFFFILRPKMKEQKEMQKMLGALKKGDRVQTQAGMQGEISGIRDNVITLKVAENVKIDFDKSSIIRVLADQKEKA